MSEENKFTTSGQLCWDCKNSTGGCPWSAELKPVKGWVAEPSLKQTIETYFIKECPLFVRDSYNCGLERMKKK